MTDNAKFLGVTIDSMLNANKHVQTICKKASNKSELFLEVLQTLNINKMLLYRQISITDLGV